MTDKPSWDQYLMSMAFMVAMRSIDPSTKHGCVIVDDEHTILSIGYNSPPRGCKDELIPLTRPEKYDFFVHSEEAAIANAARTGTPLKGATAYVTGHPCEKCFRLLINAGIRQIIYGPVGSHCVDQKSETAVSIMQQGRTDLYVRHFDCGTDLFDKAKTYYQEKKVT